VGVDLGPRTLSWEKGQGKWGPTPRQAGRPLGKINGCWSGEAVFFGDPGGSRGTEARGRTERGKIEKGPLQEVVNTGIVYWCSVASF
jgi:hypothetical protein